MLNSKKNFISFKDFNEHRINDLIDLAFSMKKGSDKHLYLENKNLGMLFTVPSTRTRISFQVACNKLGGNVNFYNAGDLQIKNGESLSDTATIMGKYLDGLIVRMYDMNFYGQGRETLNLIAESSKIPLINALDDKDHPCQVLADILTLREKFGASYKEKKIVFSWGYSERRKSLGVPHSLLSAAALLGMNVTFAYPKGYDLDNEYVTFAEENIKTTGGKIEFTNHLDDAAKDADCIYVKNWKSLTMDTKEEDEYKNTLKSKWCLREDNFKEANKGAYYMDCMPLIRGEHVSAEVCDGPRSIMFEQAENRLYAQMAVLARIM